MMLQILNILFAIIFQSHFTRFDVHSAYSGGWDVLGRVYYIAGTQILDY